MSILSKNKTKLLGLFFTNPEDSFYIQEIGRILGKKPGTFQRTLNNLISERILISEYKGNLRLITACSGSNVCSINGSTNSIFG